MTKTTDGRPSLNAYYLTFGVQYRYEEHPYWKGADPDGWVRIMARTHDSAIAFAQAFFGERYAFLYPAENFDLTEERRYFPKGEIAALSVGSVPLRGNDGPMPIVTTSSPLLYGVPENAIVACRIEGRLRENSDADAIEKLGYEAEHTHPQCFEAASLLFAGITEVDRAVMAFELDWADPHECPVCHISIT